MTGPTASRSRRRVLGRRRSLATSRSLVVANRLVCSSFEPGQLLSSLCSTWNLNSSRRARTDGARAEPAECERAKTV